MGQTFSTEPVVEKHTETGRNETYDAAVSSCQGWRLSQEDDHSLKLELPGQHKASFFAVFDGHGSAKVSKHAAESLWRHLTENELYIKGNFKEALEQSFLSFDREVFDSYNAQLAGTTATSVLIVDNVIYCANIGDSRSVASVNCACVPLSHDHKPENPLELKRILAAGGYVLGNRVNGNLALSRAFGDFHYKSNEQLPADQQIVSPFPEIKRIELNDDVDFIVLACDGIWDVLTSEEVVEFVISRLEHEVRPDQICEQLTTRCLATDYEIVLGCDNMTVLLVCYTRGRSWPDYCTDIFNKNTQRLGLTGRKRELDNNFGKNTTRFQSPNQRYDDTTQHSDHLGISSSGDQSSEAPLNMTFANYDTPSDNETERSRSVARGQAIDDLIYLLHNGRLPGDAQSENPDGTPPISESPAEGVVTIHDDDDTSAKPSDEGDPAPTETQSQQKLNTTENEEPDKNFAADAKRSDGSKQTDEAESKVNDENLISSGTAEIDLAAAEGDEENLPNASEIEPIDLASLKESEDQIDTNEQQEVSNTIELSAPADGPDTASLGEENSQNDEIDEGIKIEESAENGNSSAVEPSPQGDTSEDTNEGS